MKGLDCLRQAFAWLKHKDLRQYIWLPLLINVLLYGTGMWALIRYFSALMNHFLPTDSWLAFLHWLLWPVIAVMIVVLVLYTFSLLANLIAAPFNGFLAAKVEALETGQAPDSGMSLAAEIWQSIAQEIRKTCFFLLWAIPILLTGFVPLLNLLTPFLWFAYSAYSAYLQYMDYPMANNGIFFTQQRPILRRRLSDIIGFGGIASFLLMIPLINLVAMPVSVIAATLHWVRHVRLNLPQTA